MTGVAAWSQVQTVWQLYVVLAAIGLVRATVLYEPAFAVIVRWFHHQRSNALLAVTLVAGFASTVALSTANALTESLGWRDALLVLAAALAVLTVLPRWLVLRRDPADLGLHPDGAAGPPPPHHGDAGLAQDARPRLRATASWAAKQESFRWYAVAFACQSTAVVIMAVHLVPLLLEYGHDVRPALLAHTFGVVRYATVSGLLAPVITLATTLGPVTAGVARTRIGTYGRPPRRRGALRRGGPRPAPWRP